MNRDRLLGRVAGDEGEMDRVWNTLLEESPSRKGRRYGNGLRRSQDSKEQGEAVLNHG